MITRLELFFIMALFLLTGCSTIPCRAYDQSSLRNSDVARIICEKPRANLFSAEGSAILSIDGKKTVPVLMRLCVLPPTEAYISPGRHNLLIMYKKSTWSAHGMVDFNVEAEKTYVIKGGLVGYRAKFWVEEAQERKGSPAQDQILFK